MNARQLILICSPSVRMDRLKNKLLRQTGFTLGQIRMVPVEKTDEQMAALASSDHSDGCFVIACGGDGTVNAVVNALLNNFGSDKTAPVMGIFPAGTGNDFATYLGLDGDLGYLLPGQNKIVISDVMTVNYHSPAGVPVSSYFLNICDIGIGGYAAKLVRKYRKVLPQSLRYEISALISFVNYKARMIEIEADGVLSHKKILSICFANGSSFANGLCIAPDSNPWDGIMGLTVLGDLRLWDYLINYRRLKHGLKIRHPEVEYLSAEYCKVKTEGIPIDLDGEFAGYSPLDVSCIAGGLRLIVPKDYTIPATRNPR